MCRGECAGEGIRGGDCARVGKRGGGDDKGSCSVSTWEIKRISTLFSTYTHAHTHLNKAYKTHAHTHSH